MFLSVNLNLIVISLFLDDIYGHIFFLSTLTIAAGESALGLSIIISYYRLKGNLSILFLNLLKN